LRKYDLCPWLKLLWAHRQIYATLKHLNELKEPILKASVDSIDGDNARVLVGDEGVAISVPVQLLPPGTHQGMVLRVRFTIDQAATNAKITKAKEKLFELDI